MKKANVRFKKGATSFYVVIFSTLLLTVIAAGFAILIISEINRSSKADLSKSAYDSALAGIEDAKAAILAYRNKCVGGSGAGDIAVTCEKARELMQNGDCASVGKILGRISEDAAGQEVLIQESSDGKNSTQQAYTCVKLAAELYDYRGTLNVANPSRIVQFGDTDVSSAKSIRLSWYSENKKLEFADDVSKLPLTGSDGDMTPPVISLSLIQSSSAFMLDDFTKTNGDQADRGTVFLIPTSTGSLDDNKISKSILVKSNDHSAQNTPQTVYCENELYNGFACSTIIELPEPIGGARSLGTFMLVVALPYAQTATDFAVELYGNEIPSTDDKLPITGAQIEIDSTGRANDLYRRIEVRIDNYDAYTPFPGYAIQLFGNDGDSNITVINGVTSEYNF